ncbi:MAG: PucR family transcriptional regulator [Ruminococcaceae bacterium]|nr:PucR family transcriptional regulator [Oscillospiraceae bacterium]
MIHKHFQNAVYQFVGIIEYQFGVLDDNSIVIAGSNNMTLGKHFPIDLDLLNDGSVVVENGVTYKPIFVRSKLEFCIYVESDSEIAKKYAQMLAATFSNIKHFYEEKYDAGNFLKNILLDSILPGEVYARSKELKLAYEVPRAVYLVNLPVQDEGNVAEILNGMFPEKGKQFVISLDEKNIAVICEVSETERSAKKQESLVSTIIDTVRAEAMVNICVGIGSVAVTLRDIAASYREAQVALEIGRVFDADKEILNYESLGIGRLIYQLPVKLCQMFLDEVFKKDSIDKLDSETLMTIQKFFDNSLNISETSRKLFIHRNTLVYRLDKIQKLTGLDLREFDDAIIFKVAMMVKKYLSANVMKI